VAALLVRCVAAKVGKQLKAAELYQAMCRVWGDVDECDKEKMGCWKSSSVLFIPNTGSTNREHM
jgi:hypothetical protein